MTAEIKRDIVALIPRLRAFAYSLTRSGADADDLVQATCERALGGLHGWAPGTRLDSWMFRIMRNQWIDGHRKRRERVSTDDEAWSGDIEGEDGREVTERRLTLAKARAAIADLPEDQRSVMVLVCVQELSYREAAEVLEVPVGTVMSRLARARKAVAERLAPATADIEQDGRTGSRPEGAGGVA